MVLLAYLLLVLVEPGFVLGISAELSHFRGAIICFSLLRQENNGFIDKSWKSIKFDLKS